MITINNLRQRVESLKELYPNLRLDGAYGKHQVVKVTDQRTGTISTLSPFLSKKELSNWLDGFEAAINLNK